MEESFSIPPEECGDSELDPRIQLELEKLNTSTTEINKLELELDESNTTFRMLLNEATRRLKALSQRLGSSVDKARPYHEAATAAQTARAACQRAAVAYQRASEIHAAAKETVALAEQRFMSNQHEWQFDNAWQEMLNHATIKVMDAETQKAESGREHQKRALVFNTAETKLQQLDDQLKRHVIKSRPYFEEKQLCQEQLATQKTRIETLQSTISKAKFRYSQSLRTLEAISEEIHMKRKDMYGDAVGECPVGPREPGVGAERDNFTDFSLELERHDLGLASSGSSSIDGCMSDETSGLEELRRRVRRLAARPVEGGAHGDTAWETELNETVNRLDQMLMMRENQAKAKERALLQSSSSSRSKSQEFINSDSVGASKLTQQVTHSLSSDKINGDFVSKNYPPPSSSYSEITSRSEPVQLSVSNLQMLSETQMNSEESTLKEQTSSNSEINTTQTRPVILSGAANDPDIIERLTNKNEDIEYKSSDIIDSFQTVTISDDTTVSRHHENCSTGSVINSIQTDEAISWEPKTFISPKPSESVDISKIVEYQKTVASPQKLPLQLSVANLSKMQSVETPQFILEQNEDNNNYNAFPYQITFDGTPKVDISNLATSMESDSIGEFPATLKAIESIVSRPEKSVKISQECTATSDSVETSMTPSQSVDEADVKNSSNLNEITVVSDEESQSCPVLKLETSSVVPLSKLDAEIRVEDASGRRETPGKLNVKTVTEDVEE